MEAKKSRSMKVYGQSGYRYKETPAIMLKGQWLKEPGFTDWSRVIQIENRLPSRLYCGQG